MTYGRLFAAEVAEQRAAGILHLLRGGLVLGPRRRRRDAVLVEDVLAVDHAHRAAVDRGAVDAVADRDVLPGALAEVRLDVLVAEVADVDERVLDLEGRDAVGLDHDHVGSAGAGR